MNGASRHSSLQHLADKDLARRSVASGLVYLTLYIIFIVFTPYANDHLTIAVLAGMMIFVAAALRTWLLVQFNTIYKHNPDTWLAGFISVFFIAGIALQGQSSTAAEATDSEAARADLEYGEEINETCAACHGEFGEGMPDGDYPRLAGLPRGYIAKQLRDFKTRARLNIPMLPYTSERELPETDLVSVAAYLEQIELPSKLPPIDEDNFDAFARLQQGKRVINIARLDGDIQAGEQLYQKECSSCHARDGYGKPAKRIPPLAGQHSSYLRRQFQKYRSGKRLHDDDPDDKALFEEISELQAHDVLSYLSTLDDG
jgi:cytochrome c553